MGETVVPEPEEEWQEWQELPRGNLRAAAVKSLAVAVPAVTVPARVLAGLDWPPGAVVAACAGDLVGGAVLAGARGGGGGRGAGRALAGGRRLPGAARGEVLELAARAAPGLLEPFLIRRPGPRSQDHK
ncbi:MULTISPECIES: hypothetical protein [Nonomuraea]|uniref:Uncharacterized protein n=1 Tax=Nonomuraea ferruginea TaxID=46174 RepID=A0ABT4T2H8_9ACTN|nr:hypothetical protein [Nonomuraea ferruginea]MDA0643703.1 hypothetical protein [Nonomuraea ferruginea]